MSFASKSAAAVLEEYEQRMEKERARSAEMDWDDFHKHRDEFLLPVGRDVGWFLHSLVVAKRPGIVLELGTSYGFSTLFLADAVQQTAGRLVTMDLADYKQAYAKEQLEKAGLADCVDFRLGDAVAMIGAEPGPFDVVLLDIWKDLYIPCLEAFYPKLADEAIVVADNMIEPAVARANVRAYRAALLEKSDLRTTLLPLGSGIEVTCRWPEASDKL